MTSLFFCAHSSLASNARNQKASIVFNKATPGEPKGIPVIPDDVFVVKNDPNQPLYYTHSSKYQPVLNPSLKVAIMRMSMGVLQLLKK